MTVKQVDLSGKALGTEPLTRKEQEHVGVLKSALQKYVRRGLGERAGYVAYQLSNKRTGYILWRRLNIIAVEDCLDANVILAVSELGRQAMKFGYDEWDGKRCSIAAAFLMAECKHDRRADEMLEICDAMEKHPDDVELRQRKEDWSKIEDYVKDQHTVIGRRMGRGDKFWIETSSFAVNRTGAYGEWRTWWQSLMLRLLGE